MKIRYLLISLMLPMFLSWQVDACSCIFIKKIDFNQFNYYQLIFKGTVLSVSKNQDEWKKIVRVVVNKSYKGQRQHDTLTIRTGFDGASCGLHFEPGQTWLIYAYNQKGVLSTGLCTRSKQLKFNPIKTFSMIREKRFLNKYGNYSGVIATKRSKGKLMNGKPVGKWEYFNNGQIRETAEYSRGGILHGTSEVYYDNGQIRYKAEYVNGEHVRSTYYDKDGNVERIYEN